MGLKDSASDAEDAKPRESAKATVTVSKTFRDGVIYLYQRSDFKKPTWMCRVKVPGGKGYVNRSTGTGDEHKAFKFADDLYNQLLVKSLTGEAPVGKRMGPVIDAYVKRLTLADPMPDVLLWNPETEHLWVIEAVTSDGEVDAHKVNGMKAFAQRCGKSGVGFTTAYRTWKEAAARQGAHRNIAVETYIWIREDPSKQLLLTA